ncbi:hypothetical protein D9619_011895 [Psilocybe cf. subviscida]|uniref:NACHT domain-containing protein n=1 Tax=Psilocybe cf. subviscida TaxID=2480587 RepID=A0A8H5B0Q6_9AGAR|nr:hypothetical protein D9619_011895 [Psilocybe cf. subviscida]
MSPAGNLDCLFNEVASNAILNAGGRADEVQCYPGTREEVIGKIERFMDGQAEPDHQMMWLSGPAGAGKSAIAQTVSERCQERGIHAVNFFFFREDRTCNHAQPLVAMLVYQLRGFYFALIELLTDCLTANPLICRASLEEQFIHLLSSPVRMVQHPPLIRRPVILIVDGLDECDDKRQQEQILQALHALVEEPHSLFRVLVASRAEHHLTMSFNTFGTSVEHIFLDDNYRPQDDIRRFVIGKFDEIKTVHSISNSWVTGPKNGTMGSYTALHSIPIATHSAIAQVKGWPANEDIEAITDKSSGQFIYAATVMRFIKYSPANPAVSLLAIRGLRPSANSPFAQLDAIYSYIFSKAPDMRAVKFCLGAHFLIQKGKLLGARELFAVVLRDMAMIEIESSLAELVAIIKVDAGPPTKLVFYHASLPDYLGDIFRSAIYNIDEGEIATELSVICLKNFYDPKTLSIAIRTLTFVKVATAELSTSLLDASSRRFEGRNRTVILWYQLMSTIERLYLQTDKTLFKRMLRHWMRFKYKNDITIGLETEFAKLSTSASWHYKFYHITERPVGTTRVDFVKVSTVKS